MGKKVAGLMRGELVFAAVLNSDAAGPVELWPHKQNFSFKYDGSLADNGTALHDWVKPRSIPLLQDYDWQLRETYEKLGLPIAKIWTDDKDKNPSFDKIVRHVVRRVAKKFIGQIAFVEVKKSTYSYELRDFGLNQPEVYPAFGIASNASYNSVKYGLEVADAEAFWKDADKAVEKVVDFCEKVLAGTWPEAHESAAVQTNWTRGMVKQIAYKSYNEIRQPEKPLLLELYGKYRAEHERKTKEIEHLTKALDSVVDSFTLASYDTSDNYLPTEDFKRDKYSSDTEWYWVPAQGTDGTRAAAKKLTKPKKDAPIKTVVEFAAKQSTFSVEDVMTKFEKLMEEDPPPAPAPPPLTMDGDGPGNKLGDLGTLGQMGAKKGDDGILDLSGIDDGGLADMEAIDREEM